MSIRRNSTTHDLATLRIHPDGSRVQQSSINRRTRTAPSTVPDTRGNWIARDAGGKVAVRKTRNASAKVDDEDGESIDIRLSDELGEEDLTARTSKKGKQKAIESDAEDSGGKRTGRNFRARKRRSFTEDLSFLEPSLRCVVPQSESTSNDDFSSSSSSESDSESEEIKITFPDPSPELLKCIHHFASRYYQEKGVLSDRSRGYRDERKTRRSKKSATNIHDQTTSKPALWTRDLSLDADDEDDQWEDEEDEREDKEDEWEDDEDDEMEDDENPSHNEEHLEKDMYKALDGSALVAIGIILQEQIAHAMTTGFSGTHVHPMRRRHDSAERSASFESD
ncbi:hypothetical protein DFH29DRAFT_1003846 [Suillus ampliporus]|nr:hypothetical protein DFH29DRAFT_1003846 [Suillus ampliporus]